MDSNHPIILSRVTVPRRRSDLLARPRLSELLNEIIDKRLILISAPAGYGKTSLMVDFATKSTMPVCWYCIDRLEQNPQRFISYFIAAIQQRFPTFGHRTLAVVKENQSQLDLDYAITVLLSDVYDHINEHFIFVIDNYHLVNEVLPVRSFINRFLREMEENIHIVLISRSLLSIPVLPIMVARSEVAGISFAELAFQPQEIQNLYYQNQHLVLSDTEAMDIQQRTEGWVTGIVLASQMNSNQEISRARLKRVSSFGLDSYFLHIIDALPVELRSFLLWSSLLDEFNAELCVKVLSPALLIEDIPWQQWMSLIQQNNLFVLPVGERGDWIRYHPLFLEFLQTRVYLEFPLEARKIEIHLARESVQKKEWDRAYVIYQKLHLTSELLDLIEETGYQILLDGKISLLSSWIDAIDQENLQSRPYIIALKGYITMLLGDKTLALSLYDQAVNSFDQQEDHLHLARTLAMRANIQRLLGNLDAALADAERCNQLIDENPELNGIKGEVLRCKGLCHFHKGKLHDALKWLTKAQAVLEAVQDRKNEAIVQMETGLVHEQLGNYTLARDWYNKALMYWEEVDNPFWLANLLNNLGVLYQLIGDYENGILSFEKALNYSQSTGYTRMEAFILTGISDVYTELQTYDNAKLGYEKATMLADAVQEHFLQVYILVQQAALAGYCENYTEGYRLIKQANTLIGLSGSEMEKYLCNLEFAGLKIAEGKGNEVIKLLETTTAFFKKEGHRVQCDKAYLYLIIACMQNQQMDKVVGPLLYIIANVDSDIPSAGLVATAARFQDIFTNNNLGFMQEQVEKLSTKIAEFTGLLPKYRKFLRENSKAIPVVAPRLFIRSMGKMLVKINDHNITNSEWQTQAAKNLFFMLLAHPEGMTKEEISILFWPEASPQDAKFRFKNTVYRLRKAIGKECVLLEQDYYRFNNKLDYEYDLELFLKEVAAAARESDPEQKILHTKAAIKQYAGKYLPEVDEEWVLGLREVLHQNYIATLLQLSEAYLEKSLYDLALELCQKALQEDNLLEDTYRLAFRIYASMGNKVGLVRLYQSCVDTLEKEISTSPSRQTQDLYKSLLK
ncbi:MAG: hypothetical protein C0391_04810 [Anaerolinea sp.]|nr:hypothetical protein [Anaerolinea sp.]